MKKKVLVAFIAAMTLFAPLYLSSQVLAPATVFAVETEDAAKYPDWVPTDYDSAAYFRNIYGATHIEDGYVCVVYKMDYEHYDPDIMIHYLRYQFRKEGDALYFLFKHFDVALSHLFDCVFFCDLYAFLKWI